MAKDAEGKKNKQVTSFKKLISFLFKVLLRRLPSSKVVFCVIWLYFAKGPLSHSKVLSRLSIVSILPEENKPGITRNLDSERTQIVNCCHTLWISLQAEAFFPYYSAPEYQEKEAYACTESLDLYS